MDGGFVVTLPSNFSRKDPHIMGRPGPQTHAKRQREQAKKEKRRAKEEKKALRKAIKSGDVDPAAVPDPALESTPESTSESTPESTPESV